MTERLTLEESIEIVRRAKEIERNANAQHARLIAERAGWQEIANELLRVSMGDDAAAFSVPPMEFLQRENLPETIRPNLAQWWANLTFKDSERRSKRELWREKTAVVENALNMRRIQRAAATNVSVQPASLPAAVARFTDAVDALIAAIDRERSRRTSTTSAVITPRSEGDHMHAASFMPLSSIHCLAHTITVNHIEYIG